MTNDCPERLRVNESDRIAELDSIRGIAAVAVLFFHLWPTLFWFGRNGVDLFFVLSGFLISGIILRNMQSENFFQWFYWRRSIRILPIYYILISAILLLNALRRKPESVASLPYYLCYLQNTPYYWGERMRELPSFGHTWTLAVEEQFYLFWPAIVWLGGRHVLPWVCGAFILLPVILRSSGLSCFTLLGHTDGLALGALLAYVTVHGANGSISRQICGVTY